jgi:hypothetical protein
VTRVVKRQGNAQALGCSPFDLMTIRGTRALALAVLGYQLAHEAKDDLQRRAIRRKLADVQEGRNFPECRT